MIRGLYTSGSGMINTQQRMDVATNNLANANTTGFKEKTYVSKTYPENDLVRTDDKTGQLPEGTVQDRPEVGPLNTGVAGAGTYTQFEQGSIRKTNNPLNMAIQGDGFFTIQGEGGEQYYTRNGNFKRNRDGQLVTSNGRPVVGENGTINLNHQTENFTVSGDGTIVDENNEVLGKLQITQFENPEKLRNMGDNLYRQGENNPVREAGDQTDFKIHQGSLEQSNTDPISELVNVIEINRLYEMNSKMVQQQSKMLNKSISSVAGS